ncbi:MAG: hypothetical protein BWY84_01063 [Candidatus Aerophobetes bacterium ADurb.Bin490]|jgi:hypothetical protein|nr:hypothetical protein [Clostridiales bacterium]OPZ62989.1 MAG: hypothetical protein BWY84_01063 [Candidatus Aerophobetes bacterium ADurb.Bin490]
MKSIGRINTAGLSPIRESVSLYAYNFKDTFSKVSFFAFFYSFIYRYYYFYLGKIKYMMEKRQRPIIPVII